MGEACPFVSCTCADSHTGGCQGKVVDMAMLLVVGLMMHGGEVEGVADHMAGFKGAHT